MIGCCTYSIIVLHNEQSVRRQTFYNATPIYTRHVN